MILEPLDGLVVSLGFLGRRSILFWAWQYFKFVQLKYHLEHILVWVELSFEAAAASQTFFVVVVFDIEPTHFRARTSEGGILIRKC